MFIRRKKEMHVYKRLAAYYLFIYLCFMQLKTLDVQAGNAVASGLPDLCLRLRLLSASSSAAANLLRALHNQAAKIGHHYAKF